MDRAENCPSGEAGGSVGWTGAGCGGLGIDFSLAGATARKSDERIRYRGNAETGGNQLGTNRGVEPPFRARSDLDLAPTPLTAASVPWSLQR